jgi:1-acyl-sn-glycerol-3-phosphate acyltransferase
MKVLYRIYSIFCYIIFLLTFLVVIPFILFFAQLKSWHRAALAINSGWSWAYFKLVGIPVRFEYEVPLDRKGQFIFCANHFSFLDIAIMAGLPIPFKFIGKRSITKAPVFGYMFRKLHITVDRSSMKSRARSVEESRAALNEGFSLTFFPEGGIVSNNPPKMVLFKEGAFRLAVEENIPIVPVSLIDNYHILPDDGAFLFRPRKSRVFVHAPIFPSDFNGDIAALKEETKRLIASKLDS